jgi:hypothetical protein
MATQAIHVYDCMLDKKKTVFLWKGSFGSFGQTVTEEKNFLNQPIRNESPMAAMFVNGSG